MLSNIIIAVILYRYIYIIYKVLEIYLQMTFINICFTDRAFYCLLRLSLTSRRLERIYKYEVSRFRIAAFLLSCFAASRCRCVTPSKQKNFKLANPELRTSFRCLTVLLRETNEQKNLLEAVAKSET